MGEMIWIEILNRHGGVIARHRCTGDTIRIGRGYANDVMLDDPYVAAEHLTVRRDAEGRLVAEDLGSANGLYLGHRRERMERRILDGDEILRIGHTYLRIRDAHHAVAPERTAAAPASAYLVTLGIAIAAFGLEALMLWLNQTGQSRFSIYATNLLGLAGVLVLWVAIWAMVCRIFSGHARFHRHLQIALVGLLIYVFARALADWLAYALPWPVFNAYQYVGTWSLLAAICFFSLREISPFRLRLKGAVVTGLALLAIAWQTFGQADRDASLSQRQHAWVLMPPSLRLFAPKKEADFFAGVEALKVKLDRDRKDNDE